MDTTSSVGHVRYMFLRNKKGTPIGCVAFRVDSNKECSRVFYATSTLHPSDKWDRARARAIAFARLNKRPIRFNNPNKFDYDVSNPKLNEVINDICLELVDDETAPTRLRKGAVLKAQHPTKTTCQ